MVQMCAGNCYRHDLQSQRAVNFVTERNATSASHYDFHHYLQAQLTNLRPHPHHQQPPHQYTHRHITANHSEMDDQPMLAPIWASQPQLMHPQPEHHISTPSFFEDCLEYPAEEATGFNPALPRMCYTGVPRSSSNLRLSYNGYIVPPVSPAAPAAPGAREGSVMAHLATDVDTTQYQPVPSDDWRKASLDFSTDDEYATSPTSTMATTFGPYTPTSSDGDASFAHAAMRRFPPHVSTSSGSFESDMFSNVGLDFQQEVAKADHVTMDPQAHMGFQCGNHFASRFGGLPLWNSNIEGFANNINTHESETQFTQGSFRDINGVPTGLSAIALTSKKRSSASSSSSADSSKEGVDSDEDADGDSIRAHSDSDQYLLNMRKKGYTYKEIKRLGKFTEAESTLRGRARVLTKEKSKRVRKPGWTDNDITLLHRGVAHVRKLKDEGACKRARNNKLPWKLIANYVSDHGGSYEFAPATCAKKWDEVLGR